MAFAASLLMAIAWVPVYSFTVLLWAPWPGVIMLMPAACRWRAGDLIVTLIQGEGSHMPINRRAGIAALIIFAAFAMHTANALYIEPNYLGFVNPQVDYANIDKLRNAIGSAPWTLSGIGHLLSGFAMVYLALCARELFREHKLVPARVALVAGVISAVGFLLTGISDLVGGGPFRSPFGAVTLMAAQNPDIERAAYVAHALARISYNSLAQVGLGWYAVLVSWCGLKTGLLGRWLCYFGYFSGLCGLLMGVMFVPLYLYTVLIWSLWYGLTLLRLRSPSATAA